MSQPDCISRPSHKAPVWVRTPEALQALVAQLDEARVIAVDSESDSLHHFPEKVCLVQMAREDGTVFLVDPLVLKDLSSLAPLCGDPGIIKVFHGASYDLSSMKRDFAFEFAGIFDTMVASQFLGLPELGLSALLERFFGIAAGRSRQKDDWAVRPLSPEQESYAAEDVRHLIPLHRRLGAELAAVRREAWVAEECRALAALPAVERVFDPADSVRLKGAKNLDRRGLAVLREVFVAREAWAHEGGRPPFKVLGNEGLLRLAMERPASKRALLRIPGCSPRVVQRYGAGLLAAIARGQALPESDLPTYPRPKKPRVAPATQRRIEELTAWRAEAATRLELDPGLLLPRRLIERLAEAAPGDREALGRIEGIRCWRVETVGDEILRVLAAAGTPADRAGRPHAAGSRLPGTDGG